VFANRGRAATARPLDRTIHRRCERGVCSEKGKCIRGVSPPPDRESFQTLEGNVCALHSRSHKRFKLFTVSPLALHSQRKRAGPHLHNLCPLPLRPPQLLPQHLDTLLTIPRCPLPFGLSHKIFHLPPLPPLFLTKLCQQTQCWLRQPQAPRRTTYRSRSHVGQYGLRDTRRAHGGILGSRVRDSDFSTSRLFLEPAQVGPRFRVGF